MLKGTLCQTRLNTLPNCIPQRSTMLKRHWTLTRNIAVCILAFVLLVSRYLTFRSDRFLATSLNVLDWYNDKFSVCQGNYTAYGHRFFKLRNAYVDPANHKHFAISCKSGLIPPAYEFVGGYALKRYTDSLQHVSERERTLTPVISQFTVAMFREYPHNFYHALTQWYNTFIIAKLFGTVWTDFHVLLLDTGPAEELDQHWKSLYRSVVKVNHLESSVTIEDLVFNIAGHESPFFYFQLERLPFIEEFSESFLNRFKLKHDKTLDCSNLSVTIVFRRDYLWHRGEPEEVMRDTERKIENEDEVLLAVKEVLPVSNVRMMISEEMTLADQLDMVVKTDILLGMHGAAMSYAMFLPSHAAVFEMYPSFWKIQHFFSSICRWRGLKHYHLTNDESSREFPHHYIYIPPAVIASYVNRMKEEMCNV